MDVLKRIFYFIIVFFLLESCKKEDQSPAPIVPDPTIPEDEIIRIPTVVHVLYSKEEFNISDAKILSQA